MAIYFFIAILVFITSFCYSHGREKYLAANMKLLCFLCMFIPAAIRMGIGTDYGSYVRIFYHLKSGVVWDTEIGWNALNLFVAHTGLYHQWIFVIASFITYLCVLQQRKHDAWIAILVWFLYLYTTSYNAVRNGISIALFWYSYMCLLRQKKLQGFLITVIALLFHTSAFLYIPVYLAMCFIKLNKKMTLIFGIIIYILFMQCHLAQIVLNSLLLGMSRYEKYMVSTVYNASVVKNTGLGMLLRYAYIFLIYCLCDEKKCDELEFSAMSIFFLILLSADILAAQMFAFYRLRDCFVTGYMAVFSVMFRYKSENIFYTVGKIGGLLYAIFIVFVWSILKNTNEIVPYTSIFGGGV